MGCNGSKLDAIGCMGSRLDEQEAVALCRGRADLLAHAARRRDALAHAHAALAASLASVSSSLHLLLLASAQPVLTLPAAAAKTVDDPPPPADKPSSPPHPSSHIDFASSTSESDSGSASSSPTHHLAAARHHDHLHHPHQFPHYGYPYPYAPDHPPYGYPYPPSPGTLHLHYARSRPPPASVAVQHPAAPSARVYEFGAVEPPRYYAYGGEPVAAAGRAAAAPTPSPPRASSWDFFNVFHGYDVHDNYCYDAGAGTTAATTPYTSSRCSRDVREEEGIPDLEDEDDAVVVKEVSSDRPVPGARCSLGAVSSSSSDKGVVAGGGTARHQAPAQPPAAPAHRKSSGSADLAGEIKAQLVRAAEAVWVLAPILEVEKRSYQHHNRRSSVYHVSSGMVSSTALPDSGYRGQELDVGGREKLTGGRSLSLTLQRLYIWEKKLYNEVKSEEKMRLLLAKNSKRLKFLDQKGVEAHKIDETQKLVRKLATKIGIAVRVIAKFPPPVFPRAPPPESARSAPLRRPPSRAELRRRPPHPRRRSASLRARRRTAAVFSAVLPMASEDVHMADLDATSTDWSSSDSDDSDIDELLNDDETEMLLLLFGMKQLEDRAKLLDQRKGSVMGHMCIPRNRALGHEQLMQDYFAEVPTYAPRLFRRRNPSNEIFSELDEINAQGPIFARSFQKTEEETKWGHEVGTHQGGVALAAPPCVGPRDALTYPFAYLKPPSRNPREPRYGNLRDAAAGPSRGIQEIASGTLPEGIHLPEDSTPPWSPRSDE
ncbi:hypothetical protein QYE76_024279 [Lolium multiflorum]|uniref:DUF632 domain-containing protein n=1 Tax=Lolium multiflorum TaxID=4521 RepID=A0AAD8REI8_LOLMU|nr:hypothetical protein QYE76_024279 [Lolium multiflorum]